MIKTCKRNVEVPDPEGSKVKLWDQNPEDLLERLEMSLLAKVDSLRETAATAQGDAKKAANADLEAALKALFKDLAFREVPEVEAQSSVAESA